MSKTANAVLGLAVGTAIGVGLGILFAPDEGKNTRKKIKDSLRDKSDEFKEQLDNLTESMREKSLELKGSLEEKVDRLFSKASNKSEDMIAILEKKLASLKEEAAKIKK